MSQESFVPKNPSTREKEIAQNAYKEADPTTYSILPPTGNLTRLSKQEEKALGSRSSTETFYQHEGDIFYDISESHPRTAPMEQVVARILKGVINFSDIVKITQQGDKRFYSRVMPMEKIREESSKDEFLADAELLTLLANDSDHVLFDTHDHNSKTENGKHVFFDFESADFTRRDIFLMKGLSLKSFYILRDKLALLEERFSGEEGRSFADSIYSDSGIDTGKIGDWPKTPDEFYNLVTHRISHAQRQVAEEIERLERPSPTAT